MLMASPSRSVTPLHGERAGVIIDVNIAGAGDADFAHLAGDEGRVAGNAAASGEDAFGGDHAAKIFGAGFDAGQDDLLALVGPLFGLGGAEDDFARCRAGAGGQDRWPSSGLQFLAAS